MEDKEIKEAIEIEIIVRYVSLGASDPKTLESAYTALRKAEGHVQGTASMFLGINRKVVAIDTVAMKRHLTSTLSNLVEDMLVEIELEDICSEDTA